jgi:hypothetical protein
VIVATGWVAISAVTTAAATLVLAFATFASVRSANRAARVAERSLLAGLRPLLMPSRLDDPEQKVGFSDNKWFLAAGGGAVAEADDDGVYLAISVRNVGSGIAVLHGWHLYANPVPGRDAHPPVEDFRQLTRDLYIAQGELGFWQGVIRDPNDPELGPLRNAIAERHRIAIDVLYGDHELGQRAITRFGLSPREDGGWIAGVGRHWNVDRPDPR